MIQAMFYFLTQQNSPVKFNFTGWGLVLAMFGAIGGVGGIVALLQSPAMRRKLGAEAESTTISAGSVVTKAALDQMNAAIEQSQRDSKRALDAMHRVDELERQVDELEAHQRLARISAAEHQIWDKMAQEELNKRGANMPPPPSLII